MIHYSISYSYWFLGAVSFLRFSRYIPALESSEYRSSYILSIYERKLERTSRVMVNQRSAELCSRKHVETWLLLLFFYLRQMVNSMNHVPFSSYLKFYTENGLFNIFQTYKEIEVKREGRRTVVNFFNYSIWHR